MDNDLTMYNPDDPGSPNPVWETMTRFKVSTYVIRVWREEPKFSVGPDYGILEKLKNVPYRSYATREERITAFIDAVKDMARISAIEVLINGDGTLFYPDWK